MATVVVNSPQAIKVGVNLQSGSTVQSLGYGVNTLKALKDFNLPPDAQSGGVVSYNAATKTFTVTAIGGIGDASITIVDAGFF